VAELITIEDPNDPRLNDYVALTDVELRRRREPEEGLFIAEGEKVIRRARTAGYRMRSMLLSSKWIDVMQRKPLSSAADLLAGTRPGERRRVVIFEDIVDHANMGAAFRNAAALGVDAVFLTPRCADPFYRRSVKVSMGAVFAVPHARLESWPQDADIFREHGFVLAALCLSENSITLDELAARPYDRLALVLGTEGEGLSAEALRASDEHVRIPMEAGVDSLNVAAASAVAFYATRRV